MAYYRYDYYSSSDSYYEQTSNESDDDDDDGFVQCPHCPNSVRRWNYDSHIRNVHTCDECGHQMPQSALKGHKERKHMERCRTCGVKMLSTPMKQHLESHYVLCMHCETRIHQSKLDEHIKNEHPFHATVGMICLSKISDQEFNRLVAANRIFSKDGHLFKRT